MPLWTKDTTSDPPKIIYAPTWANPGVVRVVYDPDAPADKRLVAEYRWFQFVDETLADLDNTFGL